MPRQLRQTHSNFIDQDNGTGARFFGVSAKCCAVSSRRRHWPWLFHMPNTSLCPTIAQHTQKSSQTCTHSEIRFGKLNLSDLRIWPQNHVFGLKIGWKKLNHEFCFSIERMTWEVIKWYQRFHHVNLFLDESWIQIQVANSFKFAFTLIKKMHHAKSFGQPIKSAHISGLYTFKENFRVFRHFHFSWFFSFLGFAVAIFGHFSSPNFLLLIHF